jgi:hypothetical protein
LNIDVSSSLTLGNKPNRTVDGFTQVHDLNSSTVLPGGSAAQASSSGLVSPSANVTVSNNVQYAVFCTSRQARVRRETEERYHALTSLFQVVSLPSQVCLAKQKIEEKTTNSSGVFLRAAVVRVAGSFP